MYISPVLIHVNVQTPIAVSLPLTCMKIEKAYLLLPIPNLNNNDCLCVCTVLVYIMQYHVNTCITFHTAYYSERFKLLKRRKTGGEKIKKSVSSTSGISESSLLQSCSLPPTVIHSTKEGGAGRSRDPTKGLSHSSSEIGRFEDGIVV